MTHQIALDSLYQRFQALVAEIDIKGEMIKPYQINGLHELASEAEKLLAGTRRKGERRT